MDRQRRQENPQGRRTASRAAKTRRWRKSLNFLIMGAFIFVIAVIVLATPKEPLGHATYTNETASGLTGTGTRLADAYKGLVISEIMSANGAAVTDENGKYSDWLEIWNSSENDMRLDGVGLSDRSDRIRFLFPDITLRANGRILVFCTNTNKNTPGEAFHAKLKLSSVGETVYLFDPNAYLIDSCKYPILSTDESYALTDEGYQIVPWFSPGFPNTEEGHRAYRESVMVTNGSIVINEVMADPLTGLRDADDELSDWIELYNTTGSNILLDNYALSDNEGKPLKWRFPKGDMIPAHGYYLVFCSGKDRVDTASKVPHTNFRLSAEAETIILADSSGRVVDRVMIDNLPEDCSFGRNENGALQVFQTATPLMPNNESGFRQMDQQLMALNRTGVYISEVLASNDSIVTFPNAGFTDWVELYNSGSESVDLTGYGLSDRLTRGRKWQFPYGTFIAPGEHKVILCDGTGTVTNTGELHAGIKLSRQGGETVCLTDPEGRILDKMILPEQRTNVSYGRTYGMSGFFYYDTPTPFQTNGPGFIGFTPTPSFTTEGGLHYSTVYTEIRVPEGTQVYYTTDGSTPTEASTPYNGERLEMKFTGVLRARAFAADGRKPSETATATYLINVYHTLPVFSVVTDPEILWNEENGMLVTGKNVVKEPGVLPFQNTVYRRVKNSGVKFPVNVEMYDTDGTKVLNQLAEFGLMGDYSLDMPQKSMKFRAKSLYGNKTFAAALFPDRPYTEYKSFVLRNSGNDCMWTRLLDGFESRLLDYYGSTVIHQAWRPSVVYLNGAYWGHMNLRERVDRFFVAQFEGLSLDEADQMTILQASGAAKYGSNKEYKGMIKKIKAGDPAKNPADLQYILDNVDVDNFLEYMALETFMGNSDIGNTRYYRLKKPGSKWKWIWYDADYGLYLSTFDSPKSYTKKVGLGQQKIDNTIFLKLLSVPEYKAKYLEKLGSIFKKFTTNNMLEVLEPLVDEIKPEMTLHWARWGEENDQFVISEVPVTIDGAYRYWEQRVNRLRNTLKVRPYRLWQYIQQGYDLTDAQMNEYFGPRPELLPDAKL